jgi:hypothetical protein
LVNCFLVTWYDVSSPATVDLSALKRARADYTNIVILLKEMGKTWWAAAAKHQLALALARVVGSINLDTVSDSEQLQYPPEPGSATSAEANAVGLVQLPTPGSTVGAKQPIPVFNENDLFSADFDADYWAAMGLDFDQDVAGNIFSILPQQSAVSVTPGRSILSHNTWSSYS